MWIEGGSGEQHRPCKNFMQKNCAHIFHGLQTKVSFNLQKKMGGKKKLQLVS